MNIEVPIVNAFVANGQGGNPAGVVVDAARFTDAEMQQIAHEVGASETAFVFDDAHATFKVRFFTPTVEVPLCGHATIATWSYLFLNKQVTTGDYTQSTEAGLIHISIDAAGVVFMEQPAQQFRENISIAEIAKLGISEAWIDQRFTPQIVQNALMIGLRSKEFLNQYTLQTAALLALNEQYDFKGLHLFVMLDDAQAVAAVRDFDPIVGIDEDAATGTTNGAFLTYLKKYDALPARDIFKIEQGEAMGQLSHLYGKFSSDRIWIGGTARQVDELIVTIAK